MSIRTQRVVLESSAGVDVSELSPIPVSVVGQGADRELVVSTYLCKTAFTGASVGDTITATQVIDVSAAPTTISTIWHNQITALDLASVPSAANLSLVGTASQEIQLGGGAISATTQRVTLASDSPGVASLASISTRSDRLAPLSTTSVDETTSGTTYLLKQGASADALAWIVVKIVVSAGVTTMTYAGPTNNPAQASATAAWTARASLVYGLPQEA